MKTVKFLKKFFELLGPVARKWVAISAVSAIALVFIEIGIAGVLQLLLIALGANFDAQSVPDILRLVPPDTRSVAIILIAIAALRAIFQVLQGQGNMMIREATLLYFRQSLLRELLSPGSKYLRSAEVQTRLAEVYPKASLCAYHLINGLISVIQTLGLGCALVLMSWRDALVALVGVFLVGVASRVSSIALRKAGQQMPAAQMRLNEGLLRIARNWLYIKIMRTEEEEHNRLNKEIGSYNLATMRGAYLTNVNGVISPFLGVLLIVTIVHLSQNVWRTEGSQVLAFLYMLVRFISALTATVNAHSAISLNYPQLSYALSSAAIFSNIPPQVDKVKNNAGELIDKNLCPPNIVLSGVTKSFSDSEAPILNNLSYDISGGSQIGILGPSGAGKSTLLSVVLGILIPESGSVLIGGVRASEAFENGVFKLGYVGPEPLLFEGTIRHNLMYGLKSIPTDHEIWKVLGDVQLTERISSLPNELDTNINELADVLSAGQKQRLSLARALLNKPDILILDEASSNLDEVTESLVSEVINKLKGKCTTIIVSHRRAFLNNADQIIQMGTLNVT